MVKDRWRWDSVRVAMPQGVTCIAMAQEWLSGGANASATLPITCVHMWRVAQVSFHASSGSAGQISSLTVAMCRYRITQSGAATALERPLPSTASRMSHVVALPAHREPRGLGAQGTRIDEAKLHGYMRHLALSLIRAAASRLRFAVITPLLAFTTLPLMAQEQPIPAGLTFLNNAAANRDRAAAACFGSSSVSNRTTTLVSTAIMTPNHLAFHSGAHLRGRFQFTFGPQTADHLIELGFGETNSGTQQNAIAGLFHGELRAWAPRAGNAYCLRQHDLALGGEPGGFHR